jgi:hypothetical protein
MSRLAHALAGLALSGAAIAQEPSLGPVAERYERAATYCETGKWGFRTEVKYPFQETDFRGCAHRDGRMKYVEHIDRDRQVYTWADAAGFYRYSEFGSFYKTYTDRDFPTHWGFRRERVPALNSRIFAWDLDHLEKRDSLRGLAAYKPNSARSTPERTVFERFQDAQERRGERLYLSNREQTLVRYEELKDGVVIRYAEVAAQLDGPVAEADLAHQAPFWVRFSLSNNQPVFLGALFALAALLSLGVWAWLFAHAQDAQAVLDGRRKLWRFQLIALGVTVALLGVLAVLSIVSPGSGHPPAIFAVFVLAFWAALGFGLLACFTLASYPVQWLFGAKMAR